MQYILDKLRAQHDISEFTCGEAVLDQWLKLHSLDSQNRRTTTVYIWHSGDFRAVAYFALSSHSVDPESLSKKLSRGFRAPIPAILLGKLAIDLSLQRTGLGTELLHSAMLQALKASQIAGARFLVVDALDRNVAKFYKHFGFSEFIDSDLRLVRKISDIEKDLD